MFSSGQGWCWKRAICCSTHIQGTQTCDDAITCTTGECLRRFVLCVCLHFACLVNFSWMPSQQAIQRLRSGFYQPETSHAHAKMLWHRWFYLNTVDRSVWYAFTLLFIVLTVQHSRGESHAPKTILCNLSFPTHFAGHNTFVSSGRKNSTDSEHSIRFRHYSGEFKATNDCMRPNWVLCILKSAQWHLEWCKPTCPQFFSRAMQQPGSGVKLTKKTFFDDEKRPLQKCL